MTMDRFSQGLLDPQQAKYRVCKCGAEVYNPEWWEVDYCDTCAAEKIRVFRQVLEDLLDKHNMSLKVRGSNLYIEYNEDRATEEAY